MASTTNSIITRAEATVLVQLYHEANFDLSKFANTCSETDIFDNISLSKLGTTIKRFFNTIKELKDYVFIKEMGGITDYDDINYGLPLDDIIMLHYAVDNYMYKRKGKYYCNRSYEDLEDYSFENNKCIICQEEEPTFYYYSTSYGLDEPVCCDCIQANEEWNDYKENKKDLDYVEECEDEQYDEDEQYNEEQEKREYDDGVVEADPLEEPSNGVVGADPLLAWKDGWKAAMKHMRDYAKSQAKNPIEAPICTNCDNYSVGIKKCTGTCNGQVQYCSKNCQSKDWKDNHKHLCKKITN